MTSYVFCVRVWARVCICVRAHACVQSIERDEGESWREEGGEGEGAYTEVNHNVAPVHKQNPAGEIRLGGHKALSDSVRAFAQHVVLLTQLLHWRTSFKVAKY